MTTSVSYIYVALRTFFCIHIVNGAFYDINIICYHATCSPTYHSHQDTGQVITDLLSSHLDYRQDMKCIMPSSTVTPVMRKVRTEEF